MSTLEEVVTPTKQPDELAALDYVDPYEHPGIWAILDEGCNSSTHTKQWRENAEEK